MNAAGGESRPAGFVCRAFPCVLFAKKRQMRAGRPEKKISPRDYAIHASPCAMNASRAFRHSSHCQCQRQRWKIGGFPASCDAQSPMMDVTDAKLRGIRGIVIVTSKNAGFSYDTGFAKPGNGYDECSERKAAQHSWYCRCHRRKMRDFLMLCDLQSPVMDMTKAVNATNAKLCSIHGIAGKCGVFSYRVICKAR